jgi:uncharacterized protein YxeA
MKDRVLYGIIILIWCIYFTPIEIHAQDTSSDNYYVVIAKFPNLEGAVAYTDAVNLKGFNSQYAVHQGEEHYVFLLQTDDRKKAKDFLKKIRKETEFKKAWIYKGMLGGHQ